MVGDRFPKLAVLIDADNARPSIVNFILSEIAKCGTAHAKRAYGDSTRPNLYNWKDKLLEQLIQPIQQFAYTYGKNMTGSAMIIDTMDLLYSSRYNGFCLYKTSKPFVTTCDKFIYTENFVRFNKLVPHADRVIGPESHSSTLLTQKDSYLAGQLQMTARLSIVGYLLTKNYPDFDSHSYGYHKLSDLITASSLFETARRSLREGLPTEIIVRDKRRMPKSSAK
ncbi:NYN domain-containing protein [Aspergillus alliaceus]|uniref:NYN domain-containing protein n=1 Tax=Petromyces alliaceus TaxID=209559 RepID=UPI0012A639EC|nr:uncharacterized protein BDW43DRAFT_318111 [Aspergillus alliaceus]KAB8235720.1 hypothetical protein BDW43DRAFT_318111 [Aspergillus alliaceus]